MAHRVPVTLQFACFYSIREGRVIMFVNETVIVPLLISYLCVSHKMYVCGVFQL